MRLSAPFHSNLYSLENPITIQLFLDNLQLQQLSTDQADILDAPLSLSELHNALSQMPNNKAVGSYGFPAEFLKPFWQTLNLLFTSGHGNRQTKVILP